MRRIMLKSKIHRATVTAASVDYEGSITIDRKLMAAADIYANEQVHVLDIDNGARLVTYAIPGETGEICVNGAAAKKVDVGDTVIIISYGDLASSECAGHEPGIVLVDEENSIVRVEGPTAGADARTPHPQLARSTQTNITRGTWSDGTKKRCTQSPACGCSLQRTARIPHARRTGHNQHHCRSSCLRRRYAA